MVPLSSPWHRLCLFKEIHISNKNFHPIKMNWHVLLPITSLNYFAIYQILLSSFVKQLDNRDQQLPRGVYKTTFQKHFINWTKHKIISIYIFLKTKLHIGALNPPKNQKLFHFQSLTRGGNLVSKRHCLWWGLNFDAYEKQFLNCGGQYVAGAKHLWL
jgi:hypothetical protein